MHPPCCCVLGCSGCASSTSTRRDDVSPPASITRLQASSRHCIPLAATSNCKTACSFRRTLCFMLQRNPPGDRVALHGLVFPQHTADTVVLLRRCAWHCHDCVSGTATEAEDTREVPYRGSMQAPASASLATTHSVFRAVFQRPKGEQPRRGSASRLAGVPVVAQPARGGDAGGRGAVQGRGARPPLCRHRPRGPGAPPAPCSAAAHRPQPPLLPSSAAAPVAHTGVVTQLMCASRSAIRSSNESENAVARSRLSR